MGHFLQEILKHGPVFTKKSLNKGQLFWLSPKNHEFFEKCAYFSRKILKNGYPFLPKSPIKMGRGFEARAAHPCPTQIWVPPPPGGGLNVWKSDWRKSSLVHYFNESVQKFCKVRVLGIGPKLILCSFTRRKCLIVRIKLIIWTLFWFSNQPFCIDTNKVYLLHFNFLNVPLQ